MSKPYLAALIAISLASLAIAEDRTCTFASVENPTTMGMVYYASPLGGGDCSDNRPCTFPKSLDKAQSGDHVVLKDGTYRGKFRTLRNGVTIRAENRHKAVLDGSQNAEATLTINHSNTTVRGLKIDGAKKGRLMFVASPTTPAVSNILIEHNMLIRSAASGIQVANWGRNGIVSNIVIRHNVIRDMGTFQNPGEGIYLGSSPEKRGRQIVRNVEIYGNLLEDFAHNGIDLKPNTENISAHHNILQKQTFKPHHNKKANEGTFAISGNSIRIYNNLMLNNNAGNMGAFFITPLDDNQAFGNLIKDMKSPVAFKTQTGGNRLPSEVRNNVFCNIQSSLIGTSQTVNPQALLISGNIGLGSKTPASVCEEKRIELLAEIEKLPSGPGEWRCDCKDSSLHAAKAMPKYEQNVVAKINANGISDWQVTTEPSAKNDMELVPSKDGYLFHVRGERSTRAYNLRLKGQKNPVIKVRFKRDVGNGGYAEVRVNEAKRINYRGPTTQSTDTAIMTTSSANAKIMTGPGCE